MQSKGVLTQTPKNLKLMFFGLEKIKQDVHLVLDLFVFQMLGKSSRSIFSHMDPFVVISSQGIPIIQSVTNPPYFQPNSWMISVWGPGF